MPDKEYHDLMGRNSIIFLADGNSYYTINGRITHETENRLDIDEAHVKSRYRGETSYFGKVLCAHVPKDKITLIVEEFEDRGEQK
jgi:hypothetical protein